MGGSAVTGVYPLPQMGAKTTADYSAWSRALRNSDRKAFAELFEATNIGLYRYASFITKDNHSAYDVLQDVYTKLWQIRRKLDPDRSLKALLYHMVRNRALNYNRLSRHRWQVPMEFGHAEPAADSRQDLELEARQLEEKLSGWIMELPKRRREAFVLSRFEELSHYEIAQIMGLTTKTVNNHIVLALAFLRKRLNAYVGEAVSP